MQLSGMKGNGEREARGGGVGGGGGGLRERKWERRGHFAVSKMNIFYVS